MLFCSCAAKPSYSSLRFDRLLTRSSPVFAPLHNSNRRQSHLEVPRPVRAVAELALRPFLKSIDQGAATTVLAATAPAGQVNGGEFYYDCNEQGSAEESKRRGLGRR